MDISKDDVRTLARTIDLDIPEADLNTIQLRLSSLFTLMAQIESELGDEMDDVDPVPPVYPREEF